MSSPPRTPLLRLRGISKQFRAGWASCGARVRALHDVHLSVAGGEIVQLLGAAGAGKSTLLLCAAGLLKPDEGEVWWCGEHVDEMRDGMCHIPTRAFSELHLLESSLANMSRASLALIDAPPMESPVAHDYIVAAAAARAASAGAAVVVVGRRFSPRGVIPHRVAALERGRIMSPPPCHLRRNDTGRVAEPIVP